MNTLEKGVNSEAIKKAVDTFSRLSFLLETAVKLVQTGDNVEIARACMSAATDAAADLHVQLDVVDL